MSRLWLAGVVLFAQTGAARAEEKTKLAVLDIQATGVEPELVPTLTEILTVEIDAIGKYKVIAGRDIQAMLGFEKQKDLVGCTDASCLAEIGGALGVERVVAGHIGKVGSTYVINIKLINIRKADTESRVYETVRGEVDALIDSIRNAAHKLLGEGAVAAKPAAATPRAVEPTTAPSSHVAKPAPSPVTAVTPPAPAVVATSDGGAKIGWLPISLWSVGGVAVVLGAAMGIHAKDLASKANEMQSGTTPPVHAVGTQRYASDAQAASKTANIAFAVGALACGSGFLTYYLSRPGPTATVLAPAITGNQVGLAIAGQF